MIGSNGFSRFGWRRSLLSSSGHVDVNLQGEHFFLTGEECVSKIMSIKEVDIFYFTVLDGRCQLKRLTCFFDS